MKDNISHTEILTYQPDWLEKFKIEKEILQNIFGNEALSFIRVRPRILALPPPAGGGRGDGAGLVLLF